MNDRKPSVGCFVAVTLAVMAAYCVGCWALFKAISVLFGIE